MIPVRRCSRLLMAIAMAFALLAPPSLAAAPPDDARMDWWREARFGLFIHWGLYALPAGSWGDRSDHQAASIMNSAQISGGVYAELLDGFNPEAFDAQAWVRIARDAGMRYIVITSKHHDGFSLFDSAHTEFDIMSTPCQRDLLAELADACMQSGIVLCFSHSIMDWHHPDYLPRRAWEDRPADDARFVRYVDILHEQVEELLTNYGDVGAMWFDGAWESTWTYEHRQALYEHCRALQPNVIVNNRVDTGRGGMAGVTTDAWFFGDFGTPEQEAPAHGLPGIDWASCMTMNRNWGWNAADDAWKSSSALIRRLVDVASKGGNFLLNVGPRADGTFPPEAVARLADIGAWMDVNGEAIHGTSASPLGTFPWGRCTSKFIDGTTTLYLHAFDWPEDGWLSVPGLMNTVTGVRVLGRPGETVPVRQDAEGARFRIGFDPVSEVCTVIAVDVAGAVPQRTMPAIRNSRRSSPGTSVPATTLPVMRPTWVPTAPSSVSTNCGAVDPTGGTALASSPSNGAPSIPSEVSLNGRPSFRRNVTFFWNVPPLATGPGWNMTLSANTVRKL